MDFKRDKTLPSKTYHIETDNCGTLHYTQCFQDERIVEVRGMIGKSGICPNCGLDNFCKAVSIILQSEMPRYKIIEKFKKQFIESNCGQPFTWEEKAYKSCHHLVAACVVKEIEKQIG